MKSLKWPSKSSAMAPDITVRPRVWRRIPKSAVCSPVLPPWKKTICGFSPRCAPRYAQDRSAIRQFDPDDEASRYLQVVASSHGWEGKASPIRELNGSEPIEQVLWVALAAEKDSVVFYTGMKEMVSQTDHIPLEEIIREELGHVALLQMAYGKHHK